MGQVWITGADIDDGKVQQLTVRLGSLPPRTIDRDTAVAWMKDGHSFLPGEDRPALLLVEADDATWIRDDTRPEAADSLPDLPGV